MKNFARCAFAAAWFFLLLVATAFAQFPQGAITVVLTAGPGDGSDIAMRLMAEDLRRTLKVPLVIVNKPGAGGVLATESVVRANKDGYTLLFSNNAPLTFRPVMDPDTTRYDALKELLPLGMVSRTPFLLATRSDLAYRDLAAFIAAAKKSPGAMRIATVGTGSVGDFTVDAISALTGTAFTVVPYKGATPAVTALTAGQVEGTAITMSALIAGLKSGTLRPLVISSKYPDYPDIPTLKELGHAGNLIGVWTAFFAPSGIPAEARSVLIAAFKSAITDPALRGKLLAAGLVADYSPPEEVQREMREELRMVREFARRAGLAK